jgi:O-antigen/teichoic acid export membrane protein
MIILGSALRIAFLVGFALLLLVIVTIYSGGIDFLINIPKESPLRNKIHLSLIVLSLNWAITNSICGFLHKIFPATGYYDKGIKWSIVTRFLQFLSIILAAIMGGSIVCASIGYGIVTTLTNIFILYDLKRCTPELFPWWVDGNWRMGFRDFIKAGVFTVSNFTEELSNSGVNLLVSKLISIGVVPIFSTTRTLTSMGRQATSIFVNPLVPEMVRFHALGDGRKIKETIKANWFVSGLLINIGILSILPFVENIYLTWTRYAWEFNQGLFFILAFGVSVRIYGEPLLSYLRGINDLRATLILSVTRVVLLFGCAVSFAPQYGVAGIAMGIIVSELISSGVLSTVLVVNKLKLAGECFSIPEMIVAITPSIIIGIVIISIEYSFFTLIVGSIFGIVLLIIGYLLQWNYLSTNVKERIRQMCNVKK